MAQFLKDIDPGKALDKYQLSFLIKINVSTVLRG
jgi:hypothetical protein